MLSWPQGGSYPSTCSALTHLLDNKVTRASCYLHHSHGSEPRDQPPRGWTQPQGLLAGGTTCQGPRWSFHEQGIPPALSAWVNPPARETFAQGLRPVWGPLWEPLEGRSTLLCCISSVILLKISLVWQNDYHQGRLQRPLQQGFHLFRVLRLTHALSLNKVRQSHLERWKYLKERYKVLYEVSAENFFLRRRSSILRSLDSLFGNQGLHLFHHQF